MKKIILILSMLYFGVNQIDAQQKGPHISFEKKMHDFGKIQEKNGSVTIKYIFSNTGTEPVIIQKVRSSCGCTTPDWTKTPINPGKKGFIAATFSPEGRIGAFSKTVTVTTNAELQPIVLRLKGEVSKDADNIAKSYPSTFGELRTKVEFLAFGQIKNTEVKTKYIDIYNPTDKPLKIGIENLPGHLNIESIPAIIEPKNKGKLKITYNAEKKGSWDYSLDRFKLKVNDKLIQRAIAISATINEDFSKMSEKDLAKAPKIKFKEKTFEFGTLKQGEKIEFQFEFTNEGKNDLVIRKTRASCGCTAVNMSEKEIKTGKTGVIKAVFNSAGKMGKQTKTITVITNDPKNQRIVLWIKGTVVK